MAVALAGAAPSARAQEGPPALEEPPISAAAGVGNDEVLEMVAAEFSDQTIVAIIAANGAHFDVSPRALVALKSAGVSEAVIGAMLAAEADKNRHAPAEPAASPQQAAELAKLSAMIERLATQQQATAAAEAARADPAPRAWFVSDGQRAAVAPTIAQVAFAGGGKRGERFRTLQGLAGQALAFANPAVSGIATTLGSLFRPDEQRTAVWALAARSSTRVLDTKPAFEVKFAHIPGVDPDKFEPAIVQLVPTSDNYRLVAAAETRSDERVLPSGPIVEERVATMRTRLARGEYRIEPAQLLGPGEYALVLRPVAESRRGRRRSAEASLGELLGGGTSQILYLTWEFSVPDLTPP